MEVFQDICHRERCPYALVGEATEEERLVLGDAHFDNQPIDLPMPLLFGKPPRMLREVRHHPFHKPELELDAIDPGEAVRRVLHLPAVADKTFLVTIGDRSITGMVVRDQMVGPWQVPVADVAVTSADLLGYRGEAMAIGERTPLAVIDAPASGRMAVGEAITNLAAAPVAELGDIKLSANWMAAAGHGADDAALFDTVRAVGLELCPALGIAVPVGKDSLSMQTRWNHEGETRLMTAPLSLVVSAFAPVTDVRRTLTPLLRTDLGDSDLILVDLGKGANRLGGSALAQVYRQVGDRAPDLDDPLMLRHFFSAIQELNRDGLLMAYHDRSDGGLLAAVCEMAFAGHCGVMLDLDDIAAEPLSALFCEELGAVIQVSHQDTDEVMKVLGDYGLGHHSHVIGSPNTSDHIVFRFGGQMVLDRPRIELQKFWSETSYRMQRLRDNPDCAEEAFARIAETTDPGIQVSSAFDLEENPAAPFINAGVRPRLAVLREQGVNGQLEMAAAFDRAGFDCRDVHMTDLMDGRVDLAEFKGLAACGGFSYGDVLGAGEGWAKSALFHPAARAQLEAFFNRSDTFALGVCNGCQMLSNLHELIPGAEHWPHFVRNRSEQFEARLALVEVSSSPSILLPGMEGARLPIVVAHGEGRAEFPGGLSDKVRALVSLRYVENDGQTADRYPANPNGSPEGITGLCSADGRVTIMMPHPERVFRSVQHSWHPDEWGENGPWMRLFWNARAWLE
jgi:phosphoribosylformylglycinamidine synthase